ncbi:MAG: hypothetical protein WA066_03655 [Candidatus Omnitrophota bacterium]
MMTSATGKIKGFTFVELFLVVIIIGVLIGIALPNFRKTFNYLQLNSFCSELQSAMNYFSQRAVVEGQIIQFNIDINNHEYYARIKDDSKNIKTWRIPKEIKIESGQKEINLYPDGGIDKVTIKVVNLDNQTISLTTEGVFTGVKLVPEE